MRFPRIIDIDHGKAMIVTDLHGDGYAYERLRSIFLSLREQGKTDRLIICGDLLHHYGEERDDESLDMILDVMDLQNALGRDVVMMLMGNHEMPHIYGITLAKGEMEFTPRFEHAMNRSGMRDEIIDFLKSLPIYIRTKAGVLISHAGATPKITSEEDVEHILTFDHDALLHLADDRLCNGYDLENLKQNKMYQQQASYYLAVDHPDDPRYHHLLRGQLLSQTEEEFSFLWEVLFATNEQGWNINGYNVVVHAFLKAMSQTSPYPQNVLLAGHIGVKGGHSIIGNWQLRLASFAHAYPEDAGEYLLLDCEKTIARVADLLPHLRPTFD